MTFTTFQKTIGLGFSIAVLGVLAVATQTVTPNISNAAPKPTTIEKNMDQMMGKSRMGKSMTIASGNFMASEHPTAGKAMIIEENGQKYLELSADFKSDNGPDLHVLLHRDQKPMQYHANNYLILGKLQNVQGKQRYLIPKTTNVSDFQSAVIWCKQFSATFGFAPLTMN